MRCLERHGRLGPGRYHYLLSCLKEVGRLDLAKRLSESLECPLLYLPTNFSVASQIHRLKQGTLKRKQMKYTQHMKYMSTLSCDRFFWESEWKEFFHTLCQDFVTAEGSPLPARADRRLTRFLPQHWMIYMAASHVTTFSTLKYVASIRVVAQHFSEVLIHFERLNAKLESIQKIVVAGTWGMSTWLPRLVLSWESS